MAEKEMRFKKYTKIHRFGSAENENIFDYDVTITEKIDGANTRVMKFEDKIYFGSHNQMLADDTSNKMWGGFVKWVKSRDWSNLPEGHVLYGEWMKKHTIDYGLKEPIFVAFDMFDSIKDIYWTYDELEEFCEFNGIEMVPLLFYGKTTREEAKKLIGKSFLNPEVDAEGICMKAYGQRNEWGRHLFAKIVRDEFKEANEKVFKKGGKPPIEQSICDMYTNEARVMKAVQRMMEEGVYEKDMRDMRYLKDYVWEDIFDEEETQIRSMIVDEVMPRITSKVRGTVVKLYKQMLEEGKLPKRDR